MEPVNIGLLGLGTVGMGTYRVLQRNRHEISKRAGRALNVYAACVKDVDKNRGIENPALKLYTDPFLLAEDPNVDILVELIGGCTTAKDVILHAIQCGKHVVTANKALIAEHGNEIFYHAEQKGVVVAFEGAVAGGIPIIKTLREGLGANRIDWITGIINGTCNYILTQMRTCDVDYETALAQAQAKGYAEANPEFDVAGTDSAHKLTILASLAFGIPLQLARVHCQGISTLEVMDLKFADELGYTCKHLGFAQRLPEGITLSVQPCLIPKTSLLAQVNGVMNALAIHANAVGTTLYYGAGAGGEPTASSVIADLVDVTRNISLSSKARVPYLAFESKSIQQLPIVPQAMTTMAFYLRLTVADEPGILAKITEKLAKYRVSIKSILQHPAQLNQTNVPVVLMTHPVKVGQIDSAVAEIRQCQGIEPHIVMLRMADVP